MSFNPTQPSNPVTLHVRKGYPCDINATSNAAWQQVLTVIDGPETHVLTGSGENVPMTSTDDYSNRISLPPAPVDRDIQLKFEYSRGSRSGLEPARISQPALKPDPDYGPGTFMTVIRAEDSTDNDDNDTYCEIHYQGLTA